MAIAIYQETATSRKYWAESTSLSTLRKLASGEWVLFDATPADPPPAPDGLDAAAAALTANPASLLSAAQRAAFASRTLAALGQMHAALGRSRTSPIRGVLTGGSTPAGVAAETPALSFPALLRDGFQSRWPSGNLIEPPATAVADVYTAPPQAPGVHIHSIARNGAQTADYMTDTEAIRIGGMAPGFVIHMPTSNDFYFNVSPATSKANILGRIAAVKAAMTTPCLHILIHQFERIDKGSATYPWSAYADIMREIAAADPGNVAFIDASEPFAAAGLPGSNAQGLIGPDNTHLTTAGARLLWDTIARQLMLPAPRRPLWVATDTCDRPNGSPGVADTGQAWTTETGTWTISGGKLVATAAGNIGLETRLRDVAVSAWLTVGDVSALGLLARYADDNNRCGVFVNKQAGVAELYKKVGGTSTLVGSRALTPATGSELLVETVAIGNMLYGYVDRSLFASHQLSSAELTALGRVGRVGFRASVAMGDAGWHDVAVRRP